MNVYMQTLFVCTASAFLTWWFLLGLLNPFIDSALAIIKCALYVILSFIFGGITGIYDALGEKIIHPIRRIFRPVHVPPLVKALIFFMLGALIFVLDHIYGTKIYAEDETIFYHIVFLEKTYWITQAGLVIGGFFIGLAALYLLNEMWKGINKLLSHTIRVSVVIRR